MTMRLPILQLSCRLFILAKLYITQVSQLSYNTHLAPCDFWLFLKIAVERKKIYECNGHTVHKLSQQRITAD
jgi:hypothetical protein